jgi:hypothetical protein
VDRDGDGFSIDEGDCDDTDAEVHPDAIEQLNRVDDNCDGTVDNLTVRAAAAYLDGTDTDYLGWKNSVSTGDIDGDGQLDVVVGGTYVNSYGTGGVYALDGADWSSWAGFVEDYDPTDIDGSRYYNYFGSMPQALADIDGSGGADLLVMGSDADSWGWSSTAGAIFFDLSWGDSLDAADGDVRFTSTDSSSWYTSAATGLDFDGDGSTDVFLGDYYDEGDNEGSIYIFSGDVLADGGDFEVDDDSDMEIQGAEDDDYLGSTAGGADLDDDGYGDLIVGASGASTDDLTRNGCVYIVSGRSSISGRTSVDLVSKAEICGHNEQGRLGRDGMPTVADFDGDGRLDLAVSAAGTDAWGTEGDGQVYVFLNVGTLEGEVSTSAADLTISAGSYPYFGTGLVAANLDGDDLVDLVITAPGSRTYDDDLDDHGVAYIFYGSSISGTSELRAGDADAFIVGGADQFGNGLAAGDLNSDGLDELLIASPRYEGSEGRVWIFSPE